MNFRIDKRTRKQAAVILAAGMLLTGCGKGLPMGAEVSQNKAYSLPQSMIVVATERNQYQEIYTSQIWGVELPDGETFEDYLLMQIQEFLREMKTMNLLAREKGITITGVEKEQLKKLSDEYYRSLTKEDITYMGIDRDDVTAMYHEYFLSNKVVEELTKDMDLEVSDSEAKVISIEQIVLSDAAMAESVYGQLGQEGADFAVIAKEYSEDSTIRRELGRGEEPGALEEAAFALTAGQTSQVISYEGRYYLVKCISDYEEKATQERKAKMHLERKKQAFDHICDQFKEEHLASDTNEDWNKISFSIDDKTTTTNFFELYKKYFPESAE